MTDDAFGQVLARLDRVKGTGEAVVASCPVPSHGQGRGDRNPSLSVAHRDGKVLLNCQNECHVQDILLALGLEWPDLFDEPLTLGTEWGVKVAEWVYTKPDGTPYFLVERWQNAEGKRFVQRVFGNLFEPGHARAGQMKPGYPPRFKPCLFNLPAVIAEAKRGGVIYVVEGEKSVSAARQLGLVATTGPNGAKAWRDYYTTWLVGASQVYVVCDNDDDGRRYAAECSVSIRSAGIPCHVLGVAVDKPKADLYDHVIAGYGADDLEVLHLNRLRPEGQSLTTLMSRTFPPTKWVVDRVLPTGLGLLGGTAKMGKSMVALDLALTVALGGHAFCGLACQQGDVLYLSLDSDSDARLAERAAYLMGRPAYVSSEAITLHTTWPQGREALVCCQEWAEEVKRPLLIVLDTLVRVEPEFEGNGRGSAYQASVDVLTRWAQFAQAADIAVLAVHHTRKGADADIDWIDRFLGSRGIVATAQTLLMIDAERNADEGMLRVAGRDVAHQDLAIRRSGWTWQVDNPPRPVMQVVANQPS